MLSFLKLSPALERYNALCGYSLFFAIFVTICNSFPKMSEKLASFYGGSRDENLMPANSRDSRESPDSCDSRKIKSDPRIVVSLIDSRVSLPPAAPHTY